MKAPLCRHRLILLLSVILSESVLFNFLFTSAIWAQAVEVKSEVHPIEVKPEVYPIEVKPIEVKRSLQSGGEPEPVLAVNRAADETTLHSALNTDPNADLNADPNADPSTRAADLLLETPASFGLTDRPIDVMPPSPLLSSAEVLSSMPLSQSPEAIALEDQPTPAQVVSSDAKEYAFSFSFNSRLADPTALQGSMRSRAVRTPIKNTGIAIPVSLRQGLGNGNALNLVVEGGEHIVAFDLGFTSTPHDPRRGFGVNISNQQSRFPAFRGGDRDVNLPNGNIPWIDRLAGGVEAFLPLGSEIDSAIGVSYQRVAIRDGLFTSKVFASDELGNSLTVDDDGVDDYITLNFAALLDKRDNRSFPSRGFIARFGVDQGFKISDDTLSYTRLSGGFIQYLPVHFVGFAPGPRTVILQLQAGTILGDVPPYEAFNIGGDSFVRGYDGGGIGTGSSFVQAAAEYRFPIAAIAVFSRNINLRGSLFVEYGSDLGTANEVIGNPAEARDKPGNGFGFGVGLNAESPFGLGRLEFAITDNGDTKVIATIGDRF